MAENFVQKTLDTLLNVVEVEFKIPLGFAEIKFPVTAHAKKWWKNKKSKSDVEEAIRRAEESFIAAHPDQKVAQILHELPLYSEEDFQQVITELLTHLSEEKITWLAEVKIKKVWGQIISTEEIHNALELYLPYLHHELNRIKEFREIIIARAIERIDERTKETVEGVRRIETKLDKALESRENKTKRDEPDFWYIPHPYPMPPNFTGRATEQKMLDDWLADGKDRLFILRALGGFGKSALSWQWINTHMDPAEWTKLVWWSFYEGDASFEHFIEETLKYLKLEVPQGQRPQVDELLKAMQSQKILLIMDGFERALRAYSSMNAAYQGDESPLPGGEGQGEGDCVNINAEIFLKSVCSLPGMKSKVLMTTRLTPRAVKPRGEFILGCREEELTAMQKADAVEFFHKQKIKGTHAEIEAACAPYGYHPLSLRLLAGRILKDFENPADIVVAQKLKIDGDLKQHQHHVLEVSYNSLQPHEQKLLSTIACFRSPVEHKTLESVVENKDSLDDDLHDLIERGLLHFDEKNKKFDLHPIVRRYVYFQLTDSDREEIHKKLAIFFVDELPPINKKITTMGDLAPIVELYYHMVKSGQLDLAADIYHRRLAKPLYFQFCVYLTIIELLRELFLDGENTLPQLKKSSDQGWVLNQLSISYSSSGQIYQSIPAQKIATKLMENKRDVARNVGNLADDQVDIGALREADHNLKYRIDLCREIQRKFDEGIGHAELGRFLSYIGLSVDHENIVKPL